MVEQGTTFLRNSYQMLDLSPPENSAIQSNHYVNGGECNWFAANKLNC